MTKRGDNFTGGQRCEGTTEGRAPFPDNCGQGSKGSESIAPRPTTPPLGMGNPEWGIVGMGNRPPHSPFPRLPIPDCRFPSALQSTLTPLIPDPTYPELRLVVVGGGETGADDSAAEALKNRRWHP